MATKRAISVALIFALMVITALVTMGEAAGVEPCVGDCEEFCLQNIDGADAQRCTRACDIYCGDRLVISTHDRSAWSLFKEDLKSIISNW